MTLQEAIEWIKADRRRSVRVMQGWVTVAVNDRFVCRRNGTLPESIPLAVEKAIKILENQS